MADQQEEDDAFFGEFSDFGDFGGFGGFGDGVHQQGIYHINSPSVGQGMPSAEISFGIQKKMKV